MKGLIELLQKISNWVNEADWRSWLFHGINEVPIFIGATGLAWLLLLLKIHPALVAGFTSSVVYWALREGEQRAHEMMGGIPPKDKDHLWDMVTPWAVALALMIAGQIWLF